MSIETERWELLRHQLVCRSGSRCEHCGQPLDSRWNGHHRRLRRTGPNTLSNLLALRSDCHVLIHGHPTIAVELGLIVLQTADWKTMPVTHQSGRIIRLDDYGGTETLGWNPRASQLAA